IRGTVDVGQQLHLDAVERNRLLIAIFDQAFPQVDIFALQLAIGGLDFRTWVEVDVPLAPIQGHEVARAYFPGDPADSRDRRYAQGAGQDGRVARGAAAFGDDAGDVQPVKCQRLRGQDLRGHQDHRLARVEPVA